MYLTLFLSEALRLNGDNIPEKKLNASLAELLKRMPQLIARRAERADRQSKGKISRARPSSAEIDSPTFSDGDTDSSL